MIRSLTFPIPTGFENRGFDMPIPTTGSFFQVTFRQPLPYEYPGYAPGRNTEIHRNRRNVKGRSFPDCTKSEDEDKI